jgi:SAM-dependent methyltransferase
LNCGIAFGLFDQLTEFTSAETVARNLSSHPDNTRRLLDVLTTMDLLEKKQARYRNRPIAGQFLVTHSPTYIGPLLKQIQKPELNPLDSLNQLFVHGPDPAQAAKGFANETLWAEEVKSSTGWVLGDAGRLVADRIWALPGFSSFKNMLDLGCGHGLFSVYILSAHPTLRSVLFDRDVVLKSALGFMEQWEVSDRVEFLAGDYISDDIGRGYDLVFASSTLNFTLNYLDAVILKILQALRPGGYFVAFHDGMTHEQTKPDTMLGGVMATMVSGVDYFLPQGKIAESAVRCGFRTVRSLTLETQMGAIDLDIARKSD